MSVVTSADEAVRDAVEHVDKAVASLALVVVERVWGSEEFRDDFQADIKTSFAQLTDIRDRLDI